MLVPVAGFFFRRGSVRGRTNKLCMAVQMEENMSKEGKDTTTDRRLFGPITMEHTKARLRFNCFCGRFLAFKPGQGQVACKKCGTNHVRPIYVFKVAASVV